MLPSKRKRSIIARLASPPLESDKIPKLEKLTVSFSRKRIEMVSNGRSISSTGCVSGIGVGKAHTGVQRQWIDEAGILSAAWDLREELLLLAQEIADEDGRVCGN